MTAKAGKEEELKKALLALIEPTEIEENTEIKSFDLPGNLIYPHSFWHSQSRHFVHRKSFCIYQGTKSNSFGCHILYCVFK